MNKWVSITTVVVVGKEGSGAKKARQMIIKRDKVNVRVALVIRLFWGSGVPHKVRPPCG